MSDLQLTFENIYVRVSDFLGTGLTPAGAALTKVKDIVYRGYRNFLVPKYVRNGRAHAWSFLRQDGVINTESGKWQYSLPADFAYFWYSPQFGDDSNYPSPKPVTMRQLMLYRSNITSSSYPQYWSLGTMKYDVSVGTRYVLNIHPEANGVDQIVYGYIVEPDKPTGDDEYFIGGSFASECILECALAEAEAQEDDKIGHHTSRAKDMIHTCIEMDLKRVPPTVGSMNTVDALWTDPTLARELRFIDAATLAYGV